MTRKARKTQRYRNGNAHRLVQQAKIVLVVACGMATMTLFAALGSGWQLTSFHWALMGVTAAIATLELVLEWLARRIGRDPITGQPDMAEIRNMSVPPWTPPAPRPVQARQQQLALPALPSAPPALPAPPRRAIPAPVGAPARPVLPVLPTAPAEPAIAAPVAAPVPTAHVDDDAELAAQN